MTLHRPVGELGQEGRLARAGLPDDEGYPTVAPRGGLEVGVQPGQLALPGDERVLSAAG